MYNAKTLILIFAGFFLSGILHSQVCDVKSGTVTIQQDSVYFYVNGSTISSDGNILLTGPVSIRANGRTAAFCLKTDLDGNMIWGKIYDSLDASRNFNNDFNLVKELRDGSYLLIGQTTVAGPEANDIAVMRVDAQGNQLWLRSYYSSLPAPGTGNTTYSGITDIEQDPISSDVYFTGNHSWQGSAITKINIANGDLIWSINYSTAENGGGIEFEGENIRMVSLPASNQLHSVLVNKQDGHFVSRKVLRRTTGSATDMMLSLTDFRRISNGHSLVAGKSFGAIAAVGTGTSHGFVVELDEQWNVLSSYLIQNDLADNLYATSVSIHPDGLVFFSMGEKYDPAASPVQTVMIRDGKIYHQRRRVYSGGQAPAGQRAQPLGNGGVVMPHNLSSSGGTLSRIELYKLHSSDTATTCTGLEVTGNRLLPVPFEVSYIPIPEVIEDVIRPRRTPVYSTADFTAITTNVCEVTSHCDTLNLKVSEAMICPGTDITLTITKNAGCGSLVPLDFSPGFSPGVTVINDSTYRLRIEQTGSLYIAGSLHGCGVMRDTAYLEVPESRVSVDLGADQQLCEGNSLVLNARRGFTNYVWQDGSTDSLYTVTAPGTYFVTASNACGGSFSDTVVIAANPPISIDLGPDRKRCNEEQVTITAPAGFVNYSWSDLNSGPAYAGQSITVKPSASTSYRLVAELKPGCFASDTILVEVNSSPPVDLGPDVSLCEGETRTIDAYDPAFISYQWSGSTSGSAIIVAYAGEYPVVGITQAGCVSRDTFRILNVYPLPTPSLGPDVDLCAGIPKILAVGTGYSQYSWSTGAASTTIPVSIPGQYQLTVRDQHGCYGSDEITVRTIHPLPAGFLMADTAICSYGTVVLKPEGLYKGYQWNTGGLSETVVVTQPGLYWLQVVDENGCSGRDSTLVKSKECMEGLYVPDAFSPNNDGRNDLFMPLLFGDLKFFSFQVYNRWGEVVFQTSTRDQGWDGRYNGTLQASEVFVWKCVYQLNGKERVIRSGKMLLIR